MALYLAGCSASNQPNTTSIHTTVDTRYSYQASEYVVDIPSDFVDRKADQKTTFFGYANTSITGDVLIKIIDSNSSCSPSLTGASQTEQLPNANGKAEWGKVDYFDIYYTGDFPNMQEPLCRPIVSGAGYALCSEKDGKTVVICISQMTDNSKQAKEIFETFRWTK